MRERLADSTALAASSEIGDYAIIGNCHTAALVSRDGCIDWWCPVRFDAPAVFAALLDPRVGGRWWVGPRRAFHSRRSYVEGTNVLETTFTCEDGVLRVTDFMPMRAGKGGLADGLEPRLAIMRFVECLEGSVDVGVHYEPRWNYGRFDAHLEDRGPAQGIVCVRRADALALRTEIPVIVQDRKRAVGATVLKAGEQRFLGLSFAESEPLILPPIGRGGTALLDDTMGWWRRWLEDCRYEGPYRSAVARAALTLKLMCYAPSGAIVAAPTTSLPEWIGGRRNWDYRYCWLRDASMTMRALLDLGFAQEGREFLDWLITATQFTAPRLEVMYDVYGNGVPAERTLDWLVGHRNSRPVRIGNAAARQRQLDLYGEVVGAALAYARRGGTIGAFKGRLLVGLGEHVCRVWREPDAGIWEIRGAWRAHTHSKANCWRALDGLVQLAKGGHLGTASPIARFRRAADEIRAEIETRGWNDAIGSYVSAFGGTAVDASLLLLGIQGYTDAAAPRMVSTYRHLHRQLKTGPLWLRYRPAAFQDGVGESENAFGICSFWAVEYLARLGRRDEAAQQFETLLGYANDVGLFAEEIDVASGRARGNFPQGFTHVGLISAADELARQTKGHAE